MESLISTRNNDCITEKNKKVGDNRQKM